MYDAVLFIVMVSLSGVVLLPALQSDIAIDTSIEKHREHVADEALNTFLVSRVDKFSYKMCGDIIDDAAKSIGINTSSEGLYSSILDWLLAREQIHKTHANLLAENLGCQFRLPFSVFGTNRFNIFTGDYDRQLKNETKTRKATVQIIVLQNFETETDNNIVPTVQMLADEDDDRLSVINTDADVYWDELAIRVTEAVGININGEVTQNKGAGLFADTYYKVSDNMMSGGNAHVLVHGSDFIDIEGLENLTYVTITIIHDDTDTTLGTYIFASIISMIGKD